MKIPVKEITLNRAEGPTNLCGKWPKPITTLEEAGRIIREWARTAPGLGYDKVDFTVIFEDGEEYGGRFDMQPKHLFSINPIGSHIINFCRFYTGEFKPGRMDDKQYKAALAPFSQEEQQEFRDFLNNYDLGQWYWNDD